MAHNNDYAGGGDFDNFIHAFTSDDGLTWTKIGAADQSGSIMPSTNGRDPSLLYHASGWWICSTGDGAVDKCAVFSSPSFDSGWAHLSSPDFSGVGATSVWAPQWFVDVDDSVHIIAAVQTSGTRKLYEVHPTNEAMTTWSTPVLIGGTGWATNSIDPNLTRYGGTYYLLWKDDGTGRINLSESASPLSGYALTHGSDWAGWKAGVGGGSIEGPQIVDIGTGWRLYFTQNSGYNAVHVYQSETTDRTMSSGWSSPASVPSFDGYNHPLPIKQP